MKTLSKYYEDMVLKPEPNGFCMLKPGFNQYKDEFEKLLKLNGWTIINHCTKRFTRPEIEDFYIMHKDQGFYHKLCDYMITEDCECYSCYKRCEDPYKEMGKFKKKIRDEWGEDEMRNGMHSSDNKENMIKECGIVFNKINEKLKISKNISLPQTTVTNIELFNKIDNYCKANGCKNFATSAIMNYNKKIIFLLEDDYYISNIWPKEDNNGKVFILRLANLNPQGKAKLYNIYLNGIEDDLVDWISPEQLDKIMNRLKVY